MSITLRQLRELLAVVDAGSFRAAAERLNAQQSAISRSILKFEASVGARIFDRHAAGARLTSLGTRLVPDIVAIIDAVDGLSKKVSSISQFGQNRFTLGIEKNLPIPLIQRFMLVVHQHIGDAQITLIQRDGCEIISMVREQQIQLALIRERQIPSNVSFRRFLVGGLLAALPNDGQIDGETIDPRILLGQHLHLARDDVSDETIETLREVLGTDIDLTIHDCNSAGLVGLVASGLGIGLMTVEPPEAAKVGIKMFRIEPNMPVIGIVTLWPTDWPPANLASLFDQLELSETSGLVCLGSRRSSTVPNRGEAG